MIIQNIFCRRSITTACAILTACLTFAPFVGAQEIGQGYTCSGTAILNKKGKTIKLGAAKSVIQAKIDALGSAAKNKAKKAALKKVLSNLSACSKGKLTDGGGGGGGSADVAGTYSGKFTRQGPDSPQCSISETFQASYLVTVSGGKITVDPQTNQFHSNLSGLPKAGGFEASHISITTLGKSTTTMTATALTDTSATLTVVKTFVGKVAAKNCSVTLTGPFSRFK